MHLQDGKVSYCNRFVMTSKLSQEVKAGKPLFAKIGDQLGVRGLFIVLLEKLRKALKVVPGDPLRFITLPLHMHVYQYYIHVSIIFPIQ